MGKDAVASCLRLERMSQRERARETGADRPCWKLQASCRRFARAGRIASPAASAVLPCLACLPSGFQKLDTQNQRKAEAARVQSSSCARRVGTARSTGGRAERPLRDAFRTSQKIRARDRTSGPTGGHAFILLRTRILTAM